MQFKKMYLLSTLIVIALIALCVGLGPPAPTDTGQSTALTLNTAPPESGAVDIIAIDTSPPSQLSVVNVAHNASINSPNTSTTTANANNTTSQSNVAANTSGTVNQAPMPPNTSPQATAVSSNYSARNGPTITVLNSDIKSPASTIASLANTKGEISFGTELATANSNLATRTSKSA